MTTLQAQIPAAKKQETQIDEVLLTSAADKENKKLD